MKFWKKASLLLALFLCICACKRKDELLVADFSNQIGVTQILSIADAEVTLGTDVIKLNQTMEEHGYVWSTTDSLPVVGKSTMLNLGTLAKGTVLAFSAKIISLIPQNRYFVRAYFVSNGVIGYGLVTRFSTLNGLFITDEKTKSITPFNANFSYKLTRSQSMNLLKTGLVIKIDSTNAVSDTILVVANDSLTQTASIQLDNLKKNTRYVVTPIVFTNYGYQTGSPQYFTTHQELRFNSSVASKVGSGYAIITSSIAIEAGNAKEYGICYSKRNNPILYQDSTIILKNIVSLTNFADTIRGLEQTTPYYWFVYAKTDHDTYKSEVNSFITLNSWKKELVVTQHVELLNAFPLKSFQIGSKIYYFDALSNLYSISEGSAKTDSLDGSFLGNLQVYQDDYPQSFSSAFSLFSVNNKGYYIDLYGNVYEYNPLTNEWSNYYTISSMPQQCFYFTTDKYVYLISKGLTQRLDLKSKTIVSFSMPSLIDFTTSQLGSIGIMSKLSNVNKYDTDKYYVGPCDANSQTVSMYLFDEKKNQWKTLADFPGGSRTMQSSFVVDGNLYMGMGQPLINDMWEYNLAQNRWYQRASLPYISLMDPISYTYNGAGYSGFGGYTSGFSTLRFTEFWKFTP